MNFSWRWVHKITTLSLGLFILLASITGIILSVEPYVMSRKVKSGEMDSSITLDHFMNLIKDRFIEIYSLEQDVYGNIYVEGIANETDGDRFYLDRKTGDIITPPEKLHPVFKFSRELHRSLFLKTPGRVLMGISAVGMALLLITGTALHIKRSSGITKIFRHQKVIYSLRDFHALLSKYFYIPIWIITVSAILLSIYRFFPSKSEVKSSIVEKSKRYEDIRLNDVRKITFALDTSDYTAIQLENQKWEIDSKNNVKALIDKSFYEKAKNLAYRLHTGEGILIWSFVLLISSFVLSYLSLSGMNMLWKNFFVSPIKNVGETEYENLILIGSEMGSTWRFGNALKKAIEDRGMMVRISGMDSIPKFDSVRNLFILTSTYGDGDPPYNASNAKELITERLKQCESTNFSVLGFGSRNYPKFCSYAEDLRNYLIGNSNNREQVSYSTVDKQSVFEYLEWIKKVNKNLGWDLKIDFDTLKPERKKTTNTFIIIDKKEEGDTFILRLSHNCSVFIRSGDLLGVYPEGEKVERYYSIAVMDKNELVLVIKRTGLCSNYLGNLNIGDTFSGFIKSNFSFYFPTHNNKVIFLANGTGIAPFIGMIKEPNSFLIWGGRYKKDYALFQPFLPNDRVATAFSKEGSSQYVQDLLPENKSLLVETVSSGGTIMICGSLTMLDGVMKVLENIFREVDLPSPQMLKNKGIILIDCY